MNDPYVIDYVKRYFPNHTTQSVADHLRLTVNQVRTIAKNHHVQKCEKYKANLKRQLVIDRKKWFEDNIPALNPTFPQEQIIFGSVFGDGYISRSADRSVNCYYQEHFGESQRGYREWKLSHLQDLQFIIKGNYLRSSSHPYFTALHEQLYKNNIKTINPTFLNKCIHPLFLATLYLDDGSLMVSYQHDQKSNTVYCHPSIVLYTLNFTEEENHLLARYLKHTFKTNFVVSGHPDGHRSLLKLNKVSEVTHLLDLIKPHINDISSIKYKTCLQTNIAQKAVHIKNTFGKDVRIQISPSNRRRAYTENEIETIIKMKSAGATDQTIANELNRTYWSVVYKIRELRKHHCNVSRDFDLVLDTTY